MWICSASVSLCFPLPPTLASRRSLRTAHFATHLDRRRVLGGLWPLAQGRIYKPGGGGDASGLSSDIFYVPQVGGY